MFEFLKRWRSDPGNEEEELPYIKFTATVSDDMKVYFEMALNDEEDERFLQQAFAFAAMVERINSGHYQELIHQSLQELSQTGDRDNVRKAADSILSLLNSGQSNGPVISPIQVLHFSGEQH